MSRYSGLLNEQPKEDGLKNNFHFRKLCQLLDKLPQERREMFMSELEQKRLFISSKEFSELTGVPEETVRKWLRKQTIKGKRVGKRWLIPMTEIDRLLEEAEDKESKVIKSIIKSPSKKVKLEKTIQYVLSDQYKKKKGLLQAKKTDFSEEQSIKEDK